MQTYPIFDFIRYLFKRMLISVKLNIVTFSKLIKFLGTMLSYFRKNYIFDTYMNKSVTVSGWNSCFTINIVFCTTEQNRTMLGTEI